MIKLIRAILGKLIILFDRMTPPKSLVRPKYQARIDKEMQKLSLYQIEACPFCIKVRRAMKQMNLNIELKDIQRNETSKKELLEGGGMYQAPCLKIRKDDSSVQWMYESSDIIRYLRERYSE